MTEWWRAPQYEERQPMVFPRRDHGPTRRLRDDTDAVLERTTRGSLKLRLARALDEKGQMRPPVRIFVGSCVR